MAKITFDDIIKDISPELHKIVTEDYRKNLDLQIAVIDISYKALRANIIGTSSSSKKAEYFDAIYTLLKEVVRETIPINRQFSDITKVPVDYFSKNSPGVILLENKALDHKLLIGKNTDSVRRYITTYISKHPKLINTRFGIKIQKTPILNAQNQETGSFTKKPISRAQIGHTAGVEEYLDSPLEQKILAIGNYFKDDPEISRIVKQQLETLYDIQSSISYTFRNTTPELMQGYEKVLGKGFISMTIHTDIINSRFSKLEQKIYFAIRQAIITKYNLVKQLSGSNTMLEDIAEGLIDILQGKTSGLKKHRAHTGKVESKSTKPKAKVNASIPKISLRDVRGQFTSLTNLQNLLNSKLAEQIKRNMGKGFSKSVLNNRTGRFASSAQVERLTVSKQGMITAFYSYMKSPYQTFEPGFAQGSPQTRDPKLLIGKSIREIAAASMANKLRAVSI